ncbi:hypothetical protein BDC45DRAFT_583011, partial [Circinella umbellata]
ASKITQGLVRKHFFGEVLQLTSPNEVAMMDTMVKIVDKFHKRLVAIWDAHPNKTIKTFHGLSETARDKLAMDVSIYLKHHLNDIPIDLCEKNWVSLYLVYYLFEKHISTSQRDKKQALVRTASMYLGSYMDTASESGLSAIMSSTFFEDEDDNSIAANANLSAAATSSITTTTTTTIQKHHLPSFSVPSSSSTSSMSDLVTLMQDNRYPKRPQGNFGLSSFPTSSTSSSKWQRSKTNAVVMTNHR